MNPPQHCAVQTMLQSLPCCLHACTSTLLPACRGAPQWVAAAIIHVSASILTVRLCLRHGEYAASQTLLGKGYNIGSLMARYQGLDWRDPSKAGCNAMLDPLLDGHYDGSSLQPYEVLAALPPSLPRDVCLSCCIASAMSCGVVESYSCCCAGP